MNILQEYLKDATNYLYDLSPEELEKQKERILRYGQRKDLYETFLKQVEQSPEWVKLAKTSEVRFYIEEPLKINRGCERNAYIQPGIFITIAAGNIPIIKAII